MPVETEKILNALMNKHFMTNVQFRRLHPWGDRSSIAAHLLHCARVRTFRSSSPNPLIRERLRLVLSYLESLKAVAHTKRDWEKAISQALAKIPI